MKEQTKRLHFLFALVIVLVLIALVVGVVNSSAWRFGTIKTVSKVPDGFVAEEKAAAYFGGDLQFVPFESQIAVTLDDVTIFQTDIRNSHFIVKYQGVCYINLEMLTEHAKLSTNG